MILDAITSSPINFLFTIVIGFGLAYLYYRKPSSSSSSSSLQPTSRAHPNNNSTRLVSGAGAGVIVDDLQRTIAQIERQERDMIRQEQDEAYQKSLKADKEKQLKREEDLKRQEFEEKAERDRLARQEELYNRLMKLKSEISDKLPLEPHQEDSDRVVKLVFKLPDGTRFKRSFLREDKIKYLYWYVFSLENAPLQFKMTTNFPKRDLPGRPPIPEDFSDNPNLEQNSNEPNCEQTLEEASLTETQIIFVYDLEA